jgi:hypothetical protein
MLQAMLRAGVRNVLQGVSVTPRARAVAVLLQIPCKNVGMPNHIKVWHDNTGKRPDWFLEWIRIRKKGAINWTVFPCQRWFSTHLDDCRISRILFAGHATPYIQYKVRACMRCRSMRDTAAEQP